MRAGASLRIEKAVEGFYTIHNGEGWLSSRFRPPSSVRAPTRRSTGRGRGTCLGREWHRRARTVSQTPTRSVSPADRRSCMGRRDPARPRSGQVAALESSRSRQQYELSCEGRLHQAYGTPSDIEARTKPDARGRDARCVTQGARWKAPTVYHLGRLHLPASMRGALVGF